MRVSRGYVHSRGLPNPDKQLHNIALEAGASQPAGVAAATVFVAQRSISEMPGEYCYSFIKSTLLTAHKKVPQEFVISFRNFRPFPFISISETCTTGPL
jgi:hypothetical protein